MEGREEMRMTMRKLGAGLGGLLMVFAAGGVAEPDRGARAVLELNSHLARDEPRAAPMKMRSLLGGEERYFRGTADRFFAWLAVRNPAWLNDGSCRVLLHGDVHVGNVGIYESDREGKVVLGLVDLDEVVIGPFQIDLVRAVAGLRLVADVNGVSLNDRRVAGLFESMVDRYVRALRGKSERWLGDNKLASKLLEKARSADEVAYLQRFCEGRPANRFRPVRMKGDVLRDLMEPVEEVLERDIARVVTQRIKAGELRLPGMRDGCQLLDVARWTRIESCGSQGLEKYLVLVGSVSGKKACRVMLELKYQPSPAAARAGVLEAAGGPGRAREVAGAQVALRQEETGRATAVTIGGRGFLLRRKSAREKELEPAALTTRKKLTEAAELMGHAIGLAHRNGLLRASGGRCQREVDAICERIERDGAEILRLGLEHAVEVHRQFAEFASDPAAKELAAKAERWLEEVVAHSRRSAGINGARSAE
jgi:uncharacterized protein (DUF2252 family)